MVGVSTSAAEPHIAPVAPAVELAERCNRPGEKVAECGFRWTPALRQSARFLVFQHAGNLAIQPGFREELARGNFFGDYATALGNYRFDHWSDDDPAVTDFVGHPLMGAITGRIQVQNDPAGAGLTIGTSRAYWKSRSRALAFSAAYALQWELGPLSESSIGNVGIEDYVSKHNGRRTNGTGMVDLVVTPVAGTAWLITEDAIDRWAVRRLERVSGRPIWLGTVSLLNPARSFANLLRWKAPWYRDTRAVKARPPFRR